MKMFKYRGGINKIQHFHNKTLAYPLNVISVLIRTDSGLSPEETEKLCSRMVEELGDDEITTALFPWQNTDRIIFALYQRGKSVLEAACEYQIAVGDVLKADFSVRKRLENNPRIADILFRIIRPQIDRDIKRKIKNKTQNG